MRRAQPAFKAVGGQRVPLGGLNGFAGVRGKQGRKRNKYQGYDKKKKIYTEPFDTAEEAAIRLQQKLEDHELGLLAERAPKKAQPAARNESSKTAQVGVYLGTLLAQQRAGIPTARAWLLSPQQAAALLASGIPQAVAFALA